MRLSVIIPIKISFANRFLLERVERLVEQFSIFDEIELVLIDSSEGKGYQKRLQKLSNTYENLHYTYLAMEDIYSASKARNHGSKEARGEYLLFYDVDLLVKDDFIENVLSQSLELEDDAFTIYPCLYLSESKTKAIEGKSLDNQLFESTKIRYLEGFNDEVLYLAVNTSTILVSKAHFFKIGAYNEVYKGHGYEDFELIHRLYLAYPLVSREEDYAMDFKTPFPMHYKGFRQYFAYYALPNFFKGDYTLHLWHPRPLTKKYYRHREVNLEYFIQHLQESLSLKIEKQTLFSYMEFVQNLLKEYGFGDKKYCGLSELNEVAKNQKPPFNLKRKLRRRFLNLLDRFQ